MKRLFKLTALLCALALTVSLLVSCKTDTDDDDDDVSVGSVSPYLPAEFSDKTVAALYTFEETESGNEDGISFINKAVYSIYFFNDAKWIETVSTSCTASNGYSATLKSSIAKGTYTHTGDFVNDTITLTRTHEQPEGSTDIPNGSNIVENNLVAVTPTDEEITVVNGSFDAHINDGVYTKR